MLKRRLKVLAADAAVFAGLYAWIFMDVEWAGSLDAPVLTKARAELARMVGLPE